MLQGLDEISDFILTRFYKESGIKISFRNGFGIVDRMLERGDEIAEEEESKQAEDDNDYQNRNKTVKGNIVDSFFHDFDTCANKPHAKDLA